MRCGNRGKCRRRLASNRAWAWQLLRFPIVAQSHSLRLAAILQRPHNIVLSRRGRMDLWEAIVLGIIQGLTEFLPISSTAHLLVARELMGHKDPRDAFTTA